MSPIKARKDENKLAVDLQLNPADLRKFTKPKFKVGDYVRIYKERKIFEQGYTPSWTTEVFKIHEVLNTKPVTYKIIDQNGEVILGSMYEAEMIKSQFLFGNVLRK